MWLAVCCFLLIFIMALFLLSPNMCFFLEFYKTNQDLFAAFIGEAVAVYFFYYIIGAASVADY